MVKSTPIQIILIILRNLENNFLFYILNKFILYIKNKYNVYKLA